MHNCKKKYDKGTKKTVLVYLNSKDPLSISFTKMPRRLASVNEREGRHDQILFFLYIYLFFI